MYLKRSRRKKNGEVYDYWALVESVRTERGPRQRVVATLGKLPGMDEEVRVGWEHVSAILAGKALTRDFLRGDPEPPEWAKIRTGGARAERVRRFGEVYLGLALWRRLELDGFFNELMAPGREEIAWGLIACILTLARFCSPSSELRVSEFWYGHTALEDLLGVSQEKINDDRLYRGLDALVPHKDRLFGHFQKKYGDLFGTRFDILLYDITSTYFEGQCRSNPQARRGYSRDSRSDCLQVCIALVVTPEGLPLAYEVFDGNRSDVTTVEDILMLLREKYGQERRVWVMDRGMVSEENLSKLRSWKAFYLVGTPKSMLRRFEKDLHSETDWSRLESGVEVKTVAAPEGSQETFVLCRSARRKEKETAMRTNQVAKLQKALEKLQARPPADLARAERRVGRLLGRYSRAAHLFEVKISEQPDPSGKRRLCVEISRKEELQEWAALADGCYLLRTNLAGKSAEDLWHIYMGLTQVEESFRISKNDLALRPVFHQTPSRVQAHILVCFLALVLWRVLQQWMSQSGLGQSPRKLLEEMGEVKMLDLVLPTEAGTDLRLRTVSRPEPGLAALLARLGLPLPNRPKTIQNVVATFDQKNEISQQIGNFNL